MVDKNRNVLITGGAGFIGFHLAKKFLSENYKVDIIDNFQRGKLDKLFLELAKHSRIKLIKKDINLINEKKFPKKYKYIIHLSAIVGVKNVVLNPSKVLNQNITQLIKVIEIAKKQSKLNKIVFASTSEVYAETLKIFGIKFPTPENSPITFGEKNVKRSVYALSKFYGERLCLTSNLPTVIIRPHNIYGPRMGNSHVIPELINKIITKKKLNVFSPNHKRSFCYIDDAINFIYILCTKKTPKNLICNIGNNKTEINMLNLAKKLLKIMKIDKKIFKKKNTIGSPSRRLPDLSMLHKITKYKNQYSLDEGLRKTINYYIK